MKQKELDLLEERILEEVKRRRELGGYDINAGPILLLTECIALIIQHINKKSSRRKKKK